MPSLAREGNGDSRKWSFSSRPHNKIRKVWNEESRAWRVASRFAKTVKPLWKTVDSPQSKWKMEFLNEPVVYLWACTPQDRKQQRELTKWDCACWWVVVLLQQLVLALPCSPACLSSLFIHMHPLMGTWLWFPRHFPWGRDESLCRPDSMPTHSQGFRSEFQGRSKLCLSVDLKLKRSQCVKHHCLLSLLNFLFQGVYALDHFPGFTE